MASSDQVAAVKAKGLTLRVGDAEFTANVNASDDPAALVADRVVREALTGIALRRRARG